MWGLNHAFLRAHNKPMCSFLQWRFFATGSIPVYLPGVLQVYLPQFQKTYGSQDSCNSCDVTTAQPKIIMSFLSNFISAVELLPCCSMCSVGYLGKAAHMQHLGQGTLISTMYIRMVVWIIFYFSIQLGIIIPTDFHIFQRGGSTTNQIYKIIVTIWEIKMMILGPHSASFNEDHYGPFWRSLSASTSTTNGQDVRESPEVGIW